MSYGKASWLAVVVSLTACGGGAGDPGWEGFEGREPANGGRESKGLAVDDVHGDESPSGGDDGDGPGLPPPSSGDGDGNGGGSDLVSSCSGTYECGGASVPLSRSGGECIAQVGGAQWTLESDGAIVFSGTEIGFWEGDRDQFALCVAENCIDCAR